MLLGAILVPKWSKIGTGILPFFDDFGLLAPQWRPRAPLADFLVAFLVPVLPFGSHFGDTLVFWVSFLRHFCPGGRSSGDILDLLVVVLCFCIIFNL